MVVLLIVFVVVKMVTQKQLLQPVLQLSLVVKILTTRFLLTVVVTLAQYIVDACPVEGQEPKLGEVLSILP